MLTPLIFNAPHAKLDVSEIGHVGIHGGVQSTHRKRIAWVSSVIEGEDETCGIVSVEGRG